jgi:uncharacterized protein YifN (PemK superfamily)
MFVMLLKAVARVGSILTCDFAAISNDFRLIAKNKFEDPKMPELRLFLCRGQRQIQRASTPAP